MSRASPVLESFPVESQLASPDSRREFRAAYDYLRGFIESVELQACLREASARGWIHLPSRKRRRLTPVDLPGRPLSELLKEVRD